MVKKYVIQEEINPYTGKTVFFPVPKNIVLRIINPIKYYKYVPVKKGFYQGFKSKKQAEKIMKKKVK